MPTDDQEKYRARVKDYLTRSATFAEIVEAGSYAGACDPEQIIVAVSAGTMSSGFAGAAQLKGLGADLVGVPGQAPRSFGEPIEKTLPNTELSVNIAGAMYHWVPDPNPEVLELDRELTPTLFDQYEHVADAGLQLAFDHAETPDGGHCPSTPDNME